MEKTTLGVLCCFVLLDGCLIHVHKEKLSCVLGSYIVASGPAGKKVDVRLKGATQQTLREGETE